MTPYRDIDLDQQWRNIVHSSNAKSVGSINWSHSQTGECKTFLSRLRTYMWWYIIRVQYVKMLVFNDSVEYLIFHDCFCSRYGRHTIVSEQYSQLEAWLLFSHCWFRVASKLLHQLNDISCTSVNLRPERNVSFGKIEPAKWQFNSNNSWFVRVLTTDTYQITLTEMMLSYLSSLHFIFVQSYIILSSFDGSLMKIR